MIALVTGALLLAFVLGLFWLKDRLENPTLARLAYSELNMRLAVIAVALMGVGVLLILADMFG
jgi:hypothetical protein